MKKITFLRHSKSSWDYNLDDIDRPLNNSGVVKPIYGIKMTSSKITVILFDMFFLRNLVVRV